MKLQKTISLHWTEMPNLFYMQLNKANIFRVNIITPRQYCNNIDNVIKLSEFNVSLYIIRQNTVIIL